MARAWKQIRPGTRRLDLDWPAGTLPTAESMQSVGFLNQFIGWMRYIGNFTWNDYLPEFVTAGMNIQTASFWNQIGQFNPLASPDYADNVWMDSGTDENLAANDIITTANTLAASSAYGDLLEAEPIAVGDSIHPTDSPTCFILNMLLRARTRLDMCRLIRNGVVGGGDMALPVDVLHSWNQEWAYSGTWSPSFNTGAHTAGDESNSYSLALSAQHIPTQYSSAYLSAFKVKQTARCFVPIDNNIAVSTFTFYTEGGGLSPVWQTSSGQELVISATPEVGATAEEAFASYGFVAGGTSNPTQLTSNKLALYVQLGDTLPAQFQPA